MKKLILLMLLVPVMAQAQLGMQERMKLAQQAELIFSTNAASPVTFYNDYLVKHEDDSAAELAFKERADRVMGEINFLQVSGNDNIRKYITELYLAYTDPKTTEQALQKKQTLEILADRIVRLNAARARAAKAAAKNTSEPPPSVFQVGPYHGLREPLY